MKLIISVLIIAASLVAHPAFSEDEIFTASLCEKMQSCTMQQIQDDELSEEMLGMVKAMFTQQCEAMSQLYGHATISNGLYDKAKKCATSRAALSCDELFDDDATPECDEFEKSADQWGASYE